VLVGRFVDAEEVDWATFKNHKITPDKQKLKTAPLS